MQATWPSTADGVTVRDAKLVRGGGIRPPWKADESDRHPLFIVAAAANSPPSQFSRLIRHHKQLAEGRSIREYAREAGRPESTMYYRRAKNYRLIAEALNREAEAARSTVEA